MAFQASNKKRCKFGIVNNYVYLYTMNKESNYTEKVELRHNEVAAAINKETGQVRELNPTKRKDASLKIASFNKFNKRNVMAWKLLETQTTPLEYSIANQLADNLVTHTNSLIPLNDDLTLTALSELFTVSRRSVEKVFDRLFKLGVYGKFEVYEEKEVYKKYWVFNSYLSTNGKYIKKDVEDLFKNTCYAKCL